MQSSNRLKSLVPPLGGIVFTILLLFHCGIGAATDVATPVKIGVLAIRGEDQCLARWSPTAAYLTDRIPDRTFVIVPLSHDRVFPAVAEGKIDFVLANPAIYVGLEHDYRSSRILTLKERRGNRIYTRYGGVIFSRRDRTDIRRINDLTASPSSRSPSPRWADG